MAGAHNQRDTRLLIVGAIVGALLAGTGLLERTDSGPGGNRVAVVNGESISRSEYLAYLELLARDKRNPMTAEDRRHVLDRIIEEKLLIERGLALDLARSDPSIRKGIVSAMIDTIISDASSAEPDANQLASFYRDNLQYFSHPSRIRVQRMVFRGEDAQSRAQSAHQSLETQDWQTVAETMADRDILSLPNSLLPVAKLRGYIGPSLTEAALGLQEGGVSEPLQEQAGFSILTVRERQRSKPPPLNTIREQVTREYQRRAGDLALREYLEQLREQAEINIDEAFLNQLTQAAQGAQG